MRERAWTRSVSEFLLSVVGPFFGRLFLHWRLSLLISCAILFCGRFAIKVSSEEDRESIMGKLSEAENWLYEDGFDANRTQYPASNKFFPPDP